MPKLIAPFVALLLSSFGLANAQELPASVDRGKELLAEGDKLADRKEPNGRS